MLRVLRPSRFQTLANQLSKFSVGQRRRIPAAQSKQLSNLCITPPRPSKDDPSLWIKSPFPDVELLTGVTVQELTWSRLGVGKNRENSIAFECGVTGRKYTYGQIYKKSRAFGAALMAAGFRRGDILGIILPNIPEYAIVAFGAWEAGLTVSPVNPAYTQDEIERQLVTADMKGVVTIPHFLQTALKCKSKLPLLEKVILIGDEIHPDCHSFSEMVKTSTLGVEFWTGKNMDTTNEVAMLPFSSGTTGPPKGVMLTHFNMINVTRQFLFHPDICAFNEYNDVTEGERLIGLLPFFHSYGFCGILLIGLYLGAHTLCLPKFEPETLLNAIRQHKPTSMQLVTPLISYLVNSPDYGKKEFETVHTIFAAAAPIGTTLINSLLEKAERYIFFQEGYGMTELSPISHAGNPSTRNTKVGSCGRPISNTWTKIIDIDTGKTLGRGKRGELCVKGPQVMKGYYKNDEATRATIDSNGWLHTGDVAVVDDDGFFYIVDRLKELIKVKGYQVSPSELEDVLRKHPKIGDVAVIGVPNEESGEAPRAYIVRSNENLDESEVNDYLEEKVASFKKLKGGIEFVTAIPKTPSGKILRREIMESYRQKQKS